MDDDDPKGADDPGKGYAIEVADRIEAARDEMGLTMEAMSQAVGMAKSSYAAKVYGQFNSFKISEAWDIAQLYRAKTGRRLSGWPWLSDEEMRLLDGMLDALGRK
jgi:transcriptional regulator with XRE-family HTH domain